MSTRASKGMRLLIAAAGLFVSAMGDAQTGGDGSWNFPSYSVIGNFTIDYVGVDNNQPASGNSAFVGFNYQFGGVYNGVTYTCAWNSVMLIPFYNLNAAGVPSFNAGINPAGKAMFNLLQTYVALGKPMTRIDFFLMVDSTVGDGISNHRPCVIKILESTP